MDGGAQRWPRRLSVLHKIITRMMKLLTRRVMWAQGQRQASLADTDRDSDEARV